MAKEFTSTEEYIKHTFGGSAKITAITDDKVIFQRSGKTQSVSREEILESNALKYLMEERRTGSNLVNAATLGEIDHGQSNQGNKQPHQINLEEKASFSTIWEEQVLK